MEVGQISKLGEGGVRCWMEGDRWELCNNPIPPQRLFISSKILEFPFVKDLLIINNRYLQFCSSKKGDFYKEAGVFSEPKSRRSSLRNKEWEMALLHTHPCHPHHPPHTHLCFSLPIWLILLSYSCFSVSLYIWLPQQFLIVQTSRPRRE